MKRLLALIGIALVILPVTASAQITPSTIACSQRFQDDLLAVHDTYRSYLFGSRKVVDENGDDQFEVLTGGFTDAARRGIFETQRRLSSELVTPIVETYRVYRCRSIDICTLLAQSFTQNGGQVDIQPLGCALETVDRYPECFLSADSSRPGLQSDVTELVRQCRTVMEQTLRAEQSILRLAVGYDAGYRSMLQMAGMMDWMLEGFPTAALKAISEMVNMLGKLHQIPCFIGQCDNPRSEYLTP